MRFQSGSRRSRAKSQRTASERERRCRVSARPNPVGRALRSQPASELRPRCKGMAVPNDSSRCPVRRRSMDDPRLDGRDCKHHGCRKDQEGEIELHASHEFPTEPAGCQDRPLRNIASGTMGPQPAEASLAMPPKRPPDSLGRPLIPGRDPINGRRGVAQPAAASLAMPPKRPPNLLGRPLNPGSDKVEV